jgi:hypothetical protein
VIATKCFAFDVGGGFVRKFSNAGSARQAALIGVYDRGNMTDANKSILYN